MPSGAMTDLAVILGLGIAAWIVSIQTTFPAQAKRWISAVILVGLLLYITILAVHRLTPTHQLFLPPPQ